MGKKCSYLGCFDDAVCRDGRCAHHTGAARGKAEHGHTGREPRTKAPHLGCEIECYAKDETVYTALLAQTIRGEHDGSLPNLGCEFKLCYPVDTMLSRAPAFAARLRAAGAVVDRRCGLHVHLDGRGITHRRWSQLICWLGKHQDAFWANLIPDNRWNSEYAERLCSDYDYQCRCNWSSHHTWANATSQNTIEIRLHPGSLNPHKIRGWLTVCADLMGFFRDADRDLDELPKPLDAPWSPVALEYLKARLNAKGNLRRMEDINPCAA